MQFMEVIAIAIDGFFKPTNITSGGPTSCMEDPTNIIYVVNMEDHQLSFVDIRSVPHGGQGHHGRLFEKLCSNSQRIPWKWWCL